MLNKKNASKRKHLKVVSVATQSETKREMKITRVKLLSNESALSLKYVTYGW